MLARPVGIRAYGTPGTPAKIDGDLAVGIGDARRAAANLRLDMRQEERARFSYTTTERATSDGNLDFGRRPFVEGGV
jgi:hypothetical protein